MDQKRVLIAGCGYVGQRLGELLIAQGHQVFGLVRSAESHQRLKAAGIAPVTGDITDAPTLRQLPGPYNWVVNAVSAGARGPEGYRATYVEGNLVLREWLRSQPLETYVYTSSTGVYGQDDGSTVDETSPTEPESETSRVLVAAERVLTDEAHKSGFPVIVLRVAGIYGPGRGFWLKQFLAGEARLEGDGSRWLNMIHRDDVAGCILTALERGNPGEVLNAVDDEPVRQRDLFTWLARTLGKPIPPALPESQVTTRSRVATNKRVSNAKLKTRLGYQFRFPTFREGFAAELQNR